MEPSRHAIRFPGTRGGFAQALGAVQRLLDEHRCHDASRFNVELAFEEIAMNIVNHGRPTGDVEVTLMFEHDGTVLTFEDDGPAFDPTEQAEPAVPDSIEDARIGGLGLMLVKKLSRAVVYERTPEQTNRLTLDIPVQ